MTNLENGKEYLTYVTDKLKEKIQKVNKDLAAGQKEIESMNEYYWENYTEMDQYGYEDYDNQQALFQQANANQEKLLQRQRLYRMMDSPYFGRVDFHYDEMDVTRNFYIGIANFSERPGQKPLIYDWRAPVSSLFYDYDKGPASYQAPIGEITGEIISKWQYKIRGGKMIYEFESDVKIDDEILGAELGKCGEVQLKNIVRTIQKEQNAIIRNSKDRIMVIQGVAGSGKTSIALHRIAYLLYHDCKNLKSSDILILSPNGVFSDYISHVLPELGEENIQEMSFDLFAYKQLKDLADDCEDRYDQIEKTLLNPKLNEGYKMKQSQEFLNEMEMFITELEDSLMNFCDIDYRGFVKTEEEIIDLFYFRFTDVPLLARMEAVAEYFIDEVETLRQRDMDEEERLLVTGKFLQMYEKQDVYSLYNEFLERMELAPLPNVPVEKRKLRYEDVYPILYLKYRLCGTNKMSMRKGIKHLVIDEMQDYSKLQYLIIRMLFSCRMTILGDKAQTMEEKQQDVLGFLPSIFGKDIRKIIMNKSYRNTWEIATYANNLAGIHDMELFERHGKAVEETTLASMEKAVEEIVKKMKLGAGEFETAAVITRTTEEAAKMYEMLKVSLEKECFDTKKRLTYLHKDSSKFRKGLTVTTFYLAKGLEFDQVFALFPKGDTNPLTVQAKYIAATRALHELYVCEFTNHSQTAGETC